MLFIVIFIRELFIDVAGRLVLPPVSFTCISLFSFTYLRRILLCTHVRWENISMMCVRLVILNIATTFGNTNALPSMHKNARSIFYCIYYFYLLQLAESILIYNHIYTSSLYILYVWLDY